MANDAASRNHCPVSAILAFFRLIHHQQAALPIALERPSKWDENEGKRA